MIFDNPSVINSDCGARAGAANRKVADSETAEFV